MIKESTRLLQYGLLAKDLVLSRKTTQSTAERIQQRIVTRLGSLHGLPQKIGQIVTLKDLNFNKNKLESLTEGDSRLALEDIESILEHELGHKYFDQIKIISPKGISASLGQVHKCITYSGKTLAIKVQYPFIHDLLGLDLKALGWLMEPLGGIRKKYNTNAFRKEISEMLLQELDYEKEISSLKEFKTQAKNLKRIEIPQVFEELCSKNVIAMQWHQGEAIQYTQEWNTTQRHLAANELIEFFLLSTFIWKSVHADPHPGNFRFRLEKTEPIIGILDFGCVKKLTDSFVHGLYKLISLHQSTQNQSWYLEQYELMGYDPIALEPLAPYLPKVTSILLEPFTLDEFIPDKWNVSERIKEILGTKRMQFRASGPASMIYWIRAFHGLIKYTSLLNVKLSFKKHFESLHEIYTETIPINPSTKEAKVTEKQTYKFKVRVKENGRLKVDLTFPAHTVWELEDIIPPDVENKLKMQDISVSSILASLSKEECITPQILFEYKHSSKEVKIWIE